MEAHDHEEFPVVYEPQVEVDRGPSPAISAAELRIKFCGGTTFIRRADDEIVAVQPDDPEMPHTPFILWRHKEWANAPTDGEVLHGRFRDLLDKFHQDLTGPLESYRYGCLSGWRMSVIGPGRLSKKAHRLLLLRRVVNADVNPHLSRKEIHSAVTLRGGALFDDIPTHLKQSMHWWQFANRSGALNLNDVTTYGCASLEDIPLEFSRFDEPRPQVHPIRLGETVTIYLFHCPNLIGGSGKPQNVIHHHRQARVLLQPVPPLNSIPLLIAPTLEPTPPERDQSFTPPCVDDKPGGRVPPDTEFCINCEL